MEKLGDLKKIRRFLLVIFVLSSLLMIASARSQLAAEKINGTVCVFVRELLGKVTSLFSVSLFEIFVYLSPLMIFFTLRYLFLGNFDVGKRFFVILSCFSVIPSLFFLTVAIPSQRAPVVELGDFSPSYEELVVCSEKLIESVNVLSESDDCELTPSELRSQLECSWIQVASFFGISVSDLPMPKLLIAPQIASRLGILGHYSFVTGEVNINPDIPPHEMPFSLAHEYAHYLGIAGEAEASFLAFLVCTASDFEYIKYSGALSVLEYFISDIYKNDREEYQRLYDTLSEKAALDLRASYEYTAKYSDGYMYRVADGINSTYIKALDKKGNLSYSAVSRYVTQYLLYS